MIKVINGKRYNTENAHRNGQWSTGGSLNDVHYADETLYRTPRSGAYFLHGKGHAMTRWAEHRGKLRGWGEGILPLTQEDALRWAQDKLEDTEVAAGFGYMVEDA